MKAVLISALLLYSATSSPGSIRAPGQYNGVVIFDRWGGCHLYTGVYQMEISEKVKSVLRPYDGQAILIDALEVLRQLTNLTTHNGTHFEESGESRCFHMCSRK